MNKLVIGILAHVDAGKTTLSEAILYTSGSIRRMGRVDKKDAFLDTYEMERERGITIFSRQAVFPLEDRSVTLLDTPGHVDFSAEMERTLSVLDYAILVISGADGVQGHTQTLWRLLARYGIPVFLFINKMDQPGTERGALLGQLQTVLHSGCMDFGAENRMELFENIAMCDERVLDYFLEKNTVRKEEIQALIQTRRIFPCYFGSALKLQGVKEFLEGLAKYALCKNYPEQFGAKVFKITRDEQGNRLTHLKITGGNLKVKSRIPGTEEKVNQIRIYSGDRFCTENEASAGTVCAVTGLGAARPGDGLGAERASLLPMLRPVLTYRILLPENCDPAVMLPKFRLLEEEEPQLHIVWKEELRELQAQIMGEVQTDVLKSLVKERFGVSIEFDTGNIVYRETITGCVEGVGHFEPLKHYAEVHLLLEPGEPGSGLTFLTECSTDELERNWQRLILTHLEEKEHKGVLTGAPITDMKITLLGGRAHKKHTEGGDFRQATYRALRQGLMEARSVLLEPWYEFRLEVPSSMIGRAMTDVERMHGSFEPPVQEGDTAVLTGSVPVVTMRDYQKELLSYTKGTGKLFCSLKGYEQCHNPEEIMEKTAYDAEGDLENPPGSIFCAHGAGYMVGWDKVKESMHVEAKLSAAAVKEPHAESLNLGKVMPEKPGTSIGIQEIEAILEKTFHANKRDKKLPRKGICSGRDKAVRPESTGRPEPARPVRPPGLLKKYLLVDGYNIIFAWKELKELAAVNIDSARGKLQDILCNYQAIEGCELIVVFDAYRVQNHAAESTDYHNIHVVYTAEAETADRYIERFAHEYGRQYDITVATSDYMEQIITRGQGCRLLSARELNEVIIQAGEKLCADYARSQTGMRSYLPEAVSDRSVHKLKDFQEQEE